MKSVTLLRVEMQVSLKGVLKCQILKIILFILLVAVSKC